MDVNNVLVTGFGPFQGFPINPSWATVEELSKIWDFKERLTIKKIDVSYENVEKQIPLLLDELKPMFVLHVGVSGRMKGVIDVEKCAHSTDYHKTDITGHVGPKGGNCILLNTGFNVDNIVEKCGKSFSVPIIEASTDAGRYLCEFIYYTSLHILPNKNVLFLHIPVPDDKVTINVLGEVLHKIVEICLKQLKLKSN